jgi:hypothetical protein
MKEISVIEYENMESSKDWFPNYLRVYLEWDDSKYEKMIQNIKQVLEDYSDSDLFPKSVRYFFTSEIDHIIGTVSNELFLNKTHEGFTKDEFASFLENRKSELLDLKEEFFYGEI